MKNTLTLKEEAIKAYFGTNEVNYLGNNTFFVASSDEPSGEYLVLTENERQDELKEHIRQTLWTFTSNFLSYVTDIDESIFEAIQSNGKYEANNEPLLYLVENTCGLDYLIEEAVEWDGAGHFLSSYDGVEHELENNIYAYRIG